MKKIGGIAAGGITFSTLSLVAFCGVAALAQEAPMGVTPTHFLPPIIHPTAIYGSWTYLHGTQQGNLPDIVLSASRDGALQVSLPGTTEVQVSESTCSFVGNAIVGGQPFVNIAYLVDPTVRECSFKVSQVPINGPVTKTPIVVRYLNRTPARARR